MEYTELAHKLLQSLPMFRKGDFPPKRIINSMHGEMFALLAITRCEGDVLPSEICNVMDVSSARVAATLNSLENKGLITRKIDKNDRRKILVNPTSEGNEVAEKHMQEILQETATILSFLGEHDAKEFVRILGRLVEMIPNCENSKKIN